MIYSKILQQKIKMFYGEDSLIYFECAKMRNENLPLLIRKSLAMRENLELGASNLLYIIEHAPNNETAVQLIQSIAELCKQERELLKEVEKERKVALHKGFEKRSAVIVKMKASEPVKEKRKE